MLKRLVAGSIAALLLSVSAQAATLPAGWVVEGNAGTSSPNGDVASPPEQGPGYYYVSTSAGAAGVGALPGVGGAGTPTNGSVVTTNSFLASAGEKLEFFFNYVTSDGAGYADYGWARVVNNVGDQVALLFTARTTPSGSSVPGFSMPDPEATLEPANVAIFSGTAWDALGSSSGTCFAAGCGHTGWVKSTYAFAAGGEYKLQFGVTNWNDAIYHTGLAFAGAKVGDVIITPPPDPAAIPLPASGLLLLAGFAGLAGVRRRKAA